MMKSLMRTWLLPASLLLLLPLVCHAQQTKKQIKVLRVGSSSFPYGLIEYARAIAEESGKYEIISGKEDSTGYTRLDKFISQPGLFEEWCREQLPKIQSGNYDFVIIQTIGWPGMTPDQQDRLCTQIIPELAEKIHATGAEIILYDKYLHVASDEKDPRARTWSGRYPEGYKLNYLLHIMAAKHAGIKKITFGGQAVSELWQTDHFGGLKFLYCDSSHPGPMAHYLSALDMAYLLTGENPLGCAFRNLPIGEGRERGFMQLRTSPKPYAEDLYEANKNRIGNGILTLTDEEAKTLQETAMKTQQQWGTLLKECLEDDAKFAEVMKEIRRLQGEMGKYEEYGLSEGKIASLRSAFAPPASPGELPPSLIAKIRRKSRSIDYAGAEVRKYVGRFLTREQQKSVREAYADHWLQNNSKLRDDIYFECRVATEKALRSGDREEASRLQRTGSILHMTLSFPAYLLLFENVSDEDKLTILQQYRITGGTKRASPSFATYQNEHHLDEAKLVHAWKIYMDIWSDPDLMDKLRDNGYPLEVIQEADREFAKRIAE
jgi:hypothetical protein